MTYNNSPLILIADDLSDVIADYEHQLQMARISTVQATSLPELFEVFEAFFNEIDVIILDGCIPGNSVNTIGFIKEARSRGFSRPIIAASSLYDYRMMMVEAGCSHESSKGKAAALARTLVARA